MLNYLWAAMIILGVIYGAVTGHMQQVSEAMVDSSKEAVTLCITMLGVMGMWVGIMEIAKDAGVIQTMTRKIRPFVRFMFPNLPKEHEANEHITTNIIANFLGLGWAATPAGLMAMKSLKELNGGKDTASTEMCTFLIINISSLQLIPVNIIAYRSQYGSVNPSAIVVPAILATCVSTAVGIIFAKVMAAGRQEERKRG